MMRAAARCAEHGGPPPPELALAWQCRDFGALPRAGGVLDQPAGLLARLTAARNVYAAWKSYTTEGRAAGRMAQWRRENADLADIVDNVKGLLYG